LPARGFKSLDLWIRSWQEIGPSLDRAFPGASHASALEQLAEEIESGRLTVAMHRLPAERTTPGRPKKSGKKYHSLPVRDSLKKWIEHQEILQAANYRNRYGPESAEHVGFASIFLLNALRSNAAEPVIRLFESDYELLRLQYENRSPTDSQSLEEFIKVYIHGLLKPRPKGASRPPLGG